MNIKEYHEFIEKNRCELCERFVRGRIDYVRARRRLWH